MATNQEKQNKADQTAADRDAQFVKEHPVGGAALLTGAAAIGTVQALRKPGDEVAAAYDAVMQPLRSADQNIANAPHPLDAFKARVGAALDGLDRLMQPGDMSLTHSPHPVDAAQAQFAAMKTAAAAKASEIVTAGPVKGSAIAAEAVVGAGIGMVSPQKKLGAVDDVLTGVAQAGRHHPDVPGAGIAAKEGELLPRDGVQASSGQHLQSGVDYERLNQMISAQPQPGIKDRTLAAVRDPFGAVAAKFSDAGSLLAQAASDLRPKGFDLIDARHHGTPGAEDVLAGENALRMARVERMAEAAASNPEFSRLVTGMTPDQRKALISTDAYDAHLGLERTPQAVRLESPGQQMLREDIGSLANTADQDRAAALARQTAREQMTPAERMLDIAKGAITYPGGHRPSQNDADRLVLAEKDSDVMKVLAKGVVEKTVVGKTIVAGMMVGAYQYASSGTDNEALAEHFRHAAKVEIAGDGRGGQNFNYMLKDHPELTPAVASYRAIAEEVKDPKVLQAVAERHARQIAEKGPESFNDSLQQANYLQPQQQEQQQQERGHEPAL